jgi:hypothetical protein
MLRAAGWAGDVPDWVPALHVTVTAMLTRRRSRLERVLLRGDDGARAVALPLTTAIA